MSYQIVTDSSCNLTEEAIEKLGLHIMSLSYFLNDVEYLGYEKGKKFDHKAFYDQLANKVSAKTSQVTPVLAREICEPILKEGNDILYVGFSSGLSGTYSAVHLALEELKEEYPDRKIFSVDTLSASGGEAFFVRQACKMRDEGKSIEENAAWLEENKLKMRHNFTVDDLWHLQRGGRLSAGKALVGSMLNVKPILAMTTEGKLAPTGKARGRKKALDIIVDMVADDIDANNKPKIHIIHADALEDAKYLEQQVKDRYGLETEIFFLDPVIGTHGGPGLAALIYMGKEKRDIK